MLQKGIESLKEEQEKSLDLDKMSMKKSPDNSNHIRYLIL